MPKTPIFFSSYDLVKTAALVLMLVDHVGMIFFPLDDTWRAVGRASAPLWLFLIGYARSARIDPFLIGGAVGLTVFDLAFGFAAMPLNILWTILGLRFIRWMLGDAALLRLPVLGILGLVGVVLFPLTAGYVDYGTLAVLVMLAGRAARDGSAVLKGALLLTAFLCYVILQQGIFGFAGADLTLMALGVAGSFVMLARFQPRFWSLNGPRLGQIAVRWAGRQTLILYIGHLVILKLAALALLK